MTIGPEPMTRTERIDGSRGMLTAPSPSSRLAPRRHHLDEVAEEVVAVVRARARLGVVLHGDDGQVTMAEAFDRPVVEVRVGQDQLRLLREGLGVDGEAMVLRRHLDMPRLQVLHGMVRAAMAELELERPGPAGQ